MAVDSTGDFADLVREQARRRPSDVAFTWLRDGELDAVHLTFEELDRQAIHISGALQARLPAAARVLLVLDGELDFVVAFLGCLYAGMVAVPASPPRPNRSLSGLESIVADCRPSLCLTTSRFRAAIEPRLGDSPPLAGLEWLDLNTTLSQAAAPWQPRPSKLESPAYLQYTSGSTGMPKGVIISHGNLVRNQEMMAEAFGHGDQTRCVGWLPLFHDMGLVGIALHSLYLGGHCVLIPPRFVVQKPLRWLEAISRYRATTSGAPNFAYDLCLRTIQPEPLKSLDLSCWSAALNGAEPVRAETLERFSAKFQPCGFRSKAFYPGYGQAEATVFVTGPTRGKGPLVAQFREQGGRVERLDEGETGGRKLVGCGYPRQDLRVIVVDPTLRQECAENQIGEIWISGSSVGQGYWNRPAETQATFGAMLADDTASEGSAGPFLRSGDLGFLHAGQLFVTGRLKDLIIIRGHNYHPQDIEQVVERSHAALRPTGGAAFSLDLEGEERLVVVQEVERSHRADLDAVRIIGDIREAVAAECGLRAHAIILIKTGALPKTTSGKIRRRECQRQLLSGELVVWGADYGRPDCRTAEPEL